MPINLYDDSARALAVLSDEDAGKIMRAIILAYLDGAEPRLEGPVLSIYMLVKGQTDRAEQNRLRASENGKKGGAPSGNANAKKADFMPPTVEEAEAYCRERNNGLDAKRFVDHYESNGWMEGKSPMRDWRAALRGWESNGPQPSRGRDAPVIKRPVREVAQHLYGQREYKPGELDALFYDLVI